MHSIIIVLNDEIDESELLQMMPRGTDYVTERPEMEEQAKEILERIGGTWENSLGETIFTADTDKVKECLRKAWEQYKRYAPTTFEEYIDSSKAWRASDCLTDEYGVYFYADYYGYPVPWLSFLRDLADDEYGPSLEWKFITAYDYHY